MGRFWILRHNRQGSDPFAVQPAPLLPGELRFEVAERTDPDGAEIELLESESVEQVVADLSAAGVEAVAVVFLHSYANPDHERRMAERLRATDGSYRALRQSVSLDAHRSVCSIVALVLSHPTELIASSRKRRQPD